MYKRLLPMQPN